MIKERLEALRKFKQEVSVFSLNYAKFESEQQPRLINFPVFEKGLNFYNNLNVQIIQELDNDIKHTENEIEGVKALREFQLKQLKMLFQVTTTTLNYKEKFEDTMNTLRDLPRFGDNSKVIDFRWPRVSDLLKMPTDKPIQVAKLLWKKNDKHNFCGGIQVVLSNGIKSPLFLGKDQTAQNLI